MEGKVWIIIPFISCLTCASVDYKEYPPYNGWNNNRAQPSRGAVDSALTRTLSSQYEDGVFATAEWNRASPRLISKSLMTGKSGLASVDNKTALFVFFGQHVMNEIVDVQRAGCPPEHQDILVPENDETYITKSGASRRIPHERSRYDASQSGYSPNHPRDPISEVTSFIDGDSIYGNGKVWANQLRTLGVCSQNVTDCRGELRSVADKGEFPARNTRGLPIFNPAVPKGHEIKSALRFFATGSRRNNENPFLLSVGIMWFRHHNWLARTLRAEHSDWSDEKLFNEARVRNIATYQSIVFYEWLPVLLGMDIPDYEGYKSSTPVGISNAFEGAAMRYLYTLVPPGVFVRRYKNTENKSCEYAHEPIRLCNSFWRSEDVLLENGQEAVMMGMASQLAEKEDNVVTPDLVESYYGTYQFSRADAIAISLQVGRDHGLPDYNTAREEFGLNAKTQFDDQNITEIISSLYQSFQNIDLFTGGMLETSRGRPGELFSKIILDQFIGLRNGDRFWFENRKNGLLSEQEVNETRRTTIRDVIRRTSIGTDVSAELQDHLFQWKGGNGGIGCPQPYQISSDMLEKCTELETCDYSTGNELSFAIVFGSIGLLIFAVIGLMWLVAFVIEHRKNKMSNLSNKASVEPEAACFSAKEILGKKIVRVQITFEQGGLEIQTRSKTKKKLTFQRQVSLCLSSNKGKRHMFIRPDNSMHDLFLEFETTTARDSFCRRLREELEERNVNVDERLVGKRELLSDVALKEKRDRILEEFFQSSLRSVTNLATQTPTNNFPPVGLDNERISKFEFAEYFKLKEDSTFLDKMFSHSDDGLMSAQQFCSFVVLFTSGNGKNKARRLFDMYDTNGSGMLTFDSFAAMLRSLMEIGGSRSRIQDIDEAIIQMMTSSELERQKDISFHDFEKFVEKHDVRMDCVKIATAKSKKKLSRRTRKHEIEPTQEREERSNSLEEFQRASPLRLTTRILINESISKRPLSKAYQIYLYVCKMVKQYSRHIFWLTLYCFITVGIFLQAFYVVASNNTSGLYDMAGYSLAVAKASASALTFNFSTLLLTVCWNINTFLRETFVQQFVPFDAAITMHKIAAYMGLFFAVLHTSAHGMNFYSISSQTPSDVMCLFNDIAFPSDYTPNFIFWCFQTITGVTGVVLCVVLIVMFVFASEFARRAIFMVFHWTHIFGAMLLYLFLVLHGSGMLIQEPSFFIFFLGPATLYTLDKLYSLSRRRRELGIMESEILPSDVLYLKLKRPHDFHYRAGQWIQIACPSISPHTFHPFTLSSSPNETFLTLNIRAAGPWTRDLHNKCNPENLIPYQSLPKLYVDGPFGEGHQDWYKYKVSVLVGAGIGVTPFASILKDLVYVTCNGAEVPCRTVYFIWVTRDQRQYEWMVDIIRDVEANDKFGILKTHIFITQFEEKFDLRTTMMYVCEQEFHKTEGKSLFTGLQAVTHFSRPDFNVFLGNIAQLHHEETKRIGVFTCGSIAITNSVDKACWKLNKKKGPTMCHYFENF